MGGPWPLSCQTCLWLVLLALPLAGGASLSIWLDTWFIKDHLQVIAGGPFKLDLNISTEHYHLTFDDGNRHLVVEHIPVPSDDYILHLGIVTPQALPGAAHHSSESDVKLYAGLKYYPAKQRSHKVATNAPPPSLHHACSSLGKPVHPAFHRKVIVVCEFREDFVDDGAMRTWGQHQRDNTIGLEQRLFVVDANGKDVAQKGRHATLSYSFTARVWYVFKGCDEGQPLFWQGTFILAMVYCQDASHHMYKVFISDSMDIYTSEIINNPTVGEKLQFGVSRDILKGWVRVFENGHLLKAQRDTNSADTILQSFDVVTEELQRNLVLDLSCVDQPSSATDMWDAYKRSKPNIMALHVDLPGQPAAEGKDQSEEGKAAPQQEAPKVKPIVPAVSPFPVNIYSAKRAPATLQVPGGPFTLELSVSLAQAPADKALLLLDGRSLRLWLRYRDGLCTYMLAFNRHKWISNGIPADARDPIHLAVLNAPGFSRPRMYHQVSELRLSPQDRSGNAWTTDTDHRGPVIWYDILHTALSLHDFHRLSMRKPLPDDDDVYWGLLWLFGFLVFGVGSGGLIVMLLFDVGKGSKAEKVV